MTINFAKSPPLPIYAVALVFFVAAMLCLVHILGLASSAMGYRGPTLANVPWVAGSLIIMLLGALSGVALIVRQHPLARGLMFAVTVYLAMLLPVFASCVYLARRR